MKPQETIQALETSVGRLIYEHQQLRHELTVLKDANEHQREELLRTHAELKQLRDENRRLQTAHALVADSPERDKARRQLTSIINKVDKTLELLKE